MSSRLTRFFRSIFFAPDPTEGKEYETWEVNDIAECILDGAWYCVNDGTLSKDGPQMGQRFRVAGIIFLEFPVPVTLLQFPAFEKTAYNAACFRKVRPSADEATVADAEFIDLLRPQPAQLPPVPARELEEAARWSA